MNSKLISGTGLIIALVLFLALNVLSNSALKDMRLDLTQHKLYTLSAGTRHILKNIDEPITLRFYLSKKLVSQLPNMAAYTTRVRELLEQYQRIAGNKIKLKIIDPEPFSVAEDNAVSYGIKGVPLDKANTMFYFGLAGSNSVDDHQTIPFFQPNRANFLEYDVTKLIYQLSHPKKLVVGLLSTLPLAGSNSAGTVPGNTQNQPWLIYEQMHQLFDVRKLDTNLPAIPKDIDVLMVVHPKDLTNKTLYAIDQFVLGGGHMLAFVDPHSGADTPAGTQGNPMAALRAPRSSNLGKLFKPWGLKMLPFKVAGDMSLATQVQFNMGGQIHVVDYPVWMHLKPADYNSKEIITANLGNLNVATPGILEPLKNAKTTFTPLLKTSDNAMMIPAYEVGPYSNPQQLVQNYKVGGKALVLAARISGQVDTAFPDGPPTNKGATKDKDKSSVPQLMKSKGAINVIVVADTDMLQDRFWARVQNFFGKRMAIPTAANATFITNAIDNLGGSNDLISVRSRGAYSRPFTKVEEYQRAAEKRFRDKEEQLQKRLQKTEQKLRELNRQKTPGNSLVLNSEQQQEIAKFRNEKVDIRKQLRQVQHELRKNIEQMETVLKFINIGLMPLLVGLFGILLGLYRTRRRRTA